MRAAATHERLPGDLAADVRRAQEACARYAAQYKTYLREKLAGGGFDPSASSPRFAQSVDIALGEKRIFVQEPRYYYFPGLPQIQFYPDGCFPWLAEVEAETAAIRDELLAVMQDPAAFSPYVTGDANRPRRDQLGMLNNPAWSAFYLWKNGEPVAGNAERCPKTLHALRNAPLSLTPNRSPSILFSLLEPGAHIPPHNGLVNTRLICHLPLIVPGREPLSRRKRGSRVGRGPRLGLRRHDRARGLERLRSHAGHTAVRRVAARAFRGGTAARVESFRGDRRIQWDKAGLEHLSTRPAPEISE